MSVPRVFAIDLCARLAHLLDDKISFAFGDHLLDLIDLMAWLDNEVERVSGDSVVLGRNELDGFGAGEMGAFAVEGQRRVDSMFLGAFIDPVVDPAEKLLVMRSPIGEVHTPGSARVPVPPTHAPVPERMSTALPYPGPGLGVEGDVVWRRRSKDKDVLLAVALSQERLRHRWQFARPRRARETGRIYRYRLHGPQGGDLGQFATAHLLEPGQAIRTSDGRSLEVVAVAPLETEDADYAALVETATGGT